MPDVLFVGESSQQHEWLAPQGDIYFDNHWISPLQPSIHSERIGGVDIHRYVVQTHVPDGTRMLACKTKLDFSPEEVKNLEVMVRSGHSWQARSTGMQLGFVPIEKFLAMPDRPDILYAGEKRLFPKDVGEASEFLIIRNKKNTNELMMIAQLPGDCVQSMVVSKQQDGTLSLDMVHDYEGVKGAARTMRFFMARGSSYNDLLARYREELAAVVPPPARTEAPVPTVCTWGADGLSAVRKQGDALVSDVLDTVHAIARLNKMLPPSVRKIGGMVLDDVGINPLGNPLFGDKKAARVLRKFIKELKKLNIKDRGVWMAPLLISKDSDIYKHHFDWLLKKDGKPIPFSIKQMIHADGIDPQEKKLRHLYYDEKVYILDISLPEVRDHIVAEVKRLYDMGIRVIKFDFLSAIHEGGDMRVKDKTRTECLQLLFDQIGQECPNLKRLYTTFRTYDLLGHGEGYRISPDSGLPIFQMLPDTFVGKMFKTIITSKVGTRLYPMVMERLNTFFYMQSTLASIINSQAFGMYQFMWDMFHTDADAMTIDKRQLEISNTALLEYMSGISGIYLGDKLQTMSEAAQSDLLDALIRMARMSQEFKHIDIDDLFEKLNVDVTQNMPSTLGRILMRAFNPVKNRYLE